MMARTKRSRRSYGGRRMDSPPFVKGLTGVFLRAERRIGLWRPGPSIGTTTDAQVWLGRTVWLHRPGTVPVAGPPSGIGERRTGVRLHGTESGDRVRRGSAS